MFEARTVAAETIILDRIFQLIAHQVNRFAPITCRASNLLAK
jgi:hypothetical protein